MQRVLVLGDVHGDYAALNQMLHRMAGRMAPDLVLQVGDFGYFSWLDLDHLDVPAETQLFWIDGNHEDHHAILGLVQQHGQRDPIEVADRCYYMPRGSWLTLEDGRNVLFLGGAFSVDHALRRDHCSDLELLGEAVLARIPDDLQVDVVISHTCPTEILQYLRVWMPSMPGSWDDSPDPSCDVLQRILWKYEPARWYFGHFHKFMQGEAHGCKWTSLGMVGGDPAQAHTWLDLEL